MGSIASDLDVVHNPIAHDGKWRACFGLGVIIGPHKIGATILDS